MILDGYTIIFQIINFLILVFLLRHFLYGPVIAAMNEREQKIVGREQEAAASKKKAEEESRAFRRRAEELQRQEEEIMEQARASAQEKKGELLDEARREVDATRRRWEEAFEHERETFIEELRRRIGRQACAIARRCLIDLADARLEELTWNLFLDRVRALPDEEMSKLRKALSSSDYEITLRSAFDASEDRVTEIKDNLEDTLSDVDADLNFSVRTDPTLVCGIELEVGSYRVAWSVDGYLYDIEEKILSELEHTGLPDSAQEVPGGNTTEHGE